MVNPRQMLKSLPDEAKSILSLVQKKGPLTKSQILHLTNMKLTTLNRCILPLEEMKLIIESNIGESTGGRKPLLYDVNPGRYYLVGIDISRTYTKIVVTNLKMDILCEKQFEMTLSCTPELTVQAISSIVYGIIKNLSIDKSMIIGAGLGTVGPLKREKGIMTKPANFEAPGWINVPIGNMLGTAIELPIVVDNGANLAALAESLYGDGKGFENIAYFNCGVGIRTGVISAGNTVRSINHAEDAFGHMVIDMDGELCCCGNYGCVECYCSINSITKKFISLLKRGRASNISKPLDDINYVDICQEAEYTHCIAREVINDAAASFGIALANYINLLNPGIVILSGPLIMYSNLFYQIATDRASKKCYLNDDKKIIFSKGGFFKDNAIAVGAAAVVIESILK